MPFLNPPLKSFPEMNQKFTYSRYHLTEILIILTLGGLLIFYCKFY